MPSPPFPPRPAPTTSRQDDPYARPRPTSTIPARPYIPQNDPHRTPRGILRPSPPSLASTPHDSTPNQLVSRPQPHPPIPRSTTTSQFHHHHTSSSPELRPRVDNVWAPRARPYPQQQSPDLSQTTHLSPPAHSSSHIIPPPRADQDDSSQKRISFAARINPHLVPGYRGRSASDVRVVQTPPPDLEPDRLARACGQPAPITPYRLDDRSPQSIHFEPPRTKDSPPSHPPVPKARVGHMYRRLDALSRRSNHRAMDYISFEDVAIIHKQDSHLREQLRRKRSDRLQEKDPNFHAIGAPLEDVFLYASTPIVISEYQHHLPIVVVACVEELTKTGIYQSGLFRALPSRDRHLQLIDLFDKSPDFGAHFNMRGQAMPDICALLSTFISSLPTPLIDPPIYAALWNWSIKPSVKRADARRDQQEEEDENRRARGEPSQRSIWATHTDLYLDETDIPLETDQLSVAQILLRFLPSPNISLLVYLCAFFTQLPLCPENGLQLEDVARIFGHRLLGGSVKLMSQRMMMWLLTRWHRISEGLFGDMCGMTPPPSPPSTSRPTMGSDGTGERIEKRKGKRESGSEDGLRHTASSSSLTAESPEDHGVSSRRSSSDGEEDGESSEGSRRRKKRELDVHTSRAPHVGRRVSTRKEPRHGHGHGHRASGSRRHHPHGHGHGSEHKHKNVPTSPDPFAMAFAQAQHELVDAPLLTTPPNAVAKNEGHDGPMSYDVRLSRFDHKTRRTNGDGNVNVTVDVDKLLEETAVATDAARALAERVEVLERALQVGSAVVDGQGQGQAQQAQVQGPPQGRSQGQRLGVKSRGGVDSDPGGEHDGDPDEYRDEYNGDADPGRSSGDKDAEDALRLRLRLAEAERDEAQRKLRDVRAYLLDEGSVAMP